MSLEDFDRADVQEGHLYELGRGIITVSDVPRPRHGKRVDLLRAIFNRFRDEVPASIYGIYGGAECKVLLGDLQSERHPDLSVYTTAPPTEDADVWGLWIAELVVEIVSAESMHRDYVEKPQEYLAFGIKEYWIVDPDKKAMTVLIRRGSKWQTKVYEPGDVYECRRFKGLKIDVAEVLAD
jgi:Uma2 family endonuclease